MQLINTIPPQTINLAELLVEIVDPEMFGSVQLTDIKITGLANDNRKVKPGNLFLACQGIEVHGKQFIKEAVAAGAIAILLESDSKEEAAFFSDQYPSIVVIAVDNLLAKQGFIAARFYENPSEKLSLIGITGTNGKTSCAHLLAQCLNSKQHVCGVLGTLGAGVWGDVHVIEHTTPDALELQKLLFNMQQKSAEYIAMEVSSHGLDQGRVNACQIDVGVFTNLTRDHLDYHGDIQSYGNSKLKLFIRPELTKVVVNLDDPYTFTIIKNLSDDVEIVGITINPTFDLKLYSKSISNSRFEMISAKIKVISASNIHMEQLASGLSFNVQSPWGNAQLQSNLLGDFNVSNLLSVFAVALLLDFPFQTVAEKLALAYAPAGRLETFGSDKTPLIVVDYAHTPDALEKVLLTLREYSKGKLLVLFGCGGDRDRGKRAEMGALAEAIADVVWLTNDNPRTENSQAIIDEILAGINHPQMINVDLDRKTAIEKIITSANDKDDIVLIAGKGHENYQIIGTQRLCFSDREIVAQCVGEAA